jgi:hypothetical protein
MSFKHWLRMLTVRGSTAALLMCGHWVANAAAGDNAGSRGTQSPPGAVINVAAPASHKPSIHPQMSVGTPVANHYVTADSVALAIATVPDPMVPRYGRLFDLSVLALELGMLKDGYVLDRYSFPWREALQHESEAASSKPDPPETRFYTGSYGLMIFRCDQWRGDACAFPRSKSPKAPQRVPRDTRAETRIRALYLVTETATFGVARIAFECAMRRMEVDTGAKTRGWEATVGGQPCPDSVPAKRENFHATFLNHPLCPIASDKGRNIVVLGPTFSGTLNSIGETVEGRLTNDPEGLPDPDRRLCLVSASATDRSNGSVVDKFHSVTYTTVALDNEGKLDHLAELTSALDAANPNDVAILAEASTFGFGVCAAGRQDAGALDGDGSPGEELCRRSLQVYFQPNIADIAYGLQKQQAQESGDLATAARQVQNDHHMRLEGGAENGSEFPANVSPEVTTASNQLQLEQVLDTLARRVPKVVIVVATDVRDRLFLFDQLRERLPRAMLVDLGADNLLAHPEFLHASRGALAMASANLNSVGSVFSVCTESKDKKDDVTLESWSSDVQGMLADNTAHLYETGGESPAVRPRCDFRNPAAPIRQPTPTRQAALQLVTFQGLRPVSQAFPAEVHPEDDALPGEPRRPTFDQLILTEKLAVAFITSLALLWLWPSGLRLILKCRARHQTLAGRLEKCFVGFACISGLAFLLMAPWVAYHSSDRSGRPLTYVLVALEVIGVIAALRCYSQIRNALWASRYPTYSVLGLAVLLALFSASFAAAAVWISSHLDRSNPQLDAVLLNALGFDPGSGVAFYLVVAIAATTTLYSSLIIATRTWLVRRNFRLLFLAHLAAVRSRTSMSRPASFFSCNGSKGPDSHNPHGYKPLSIWVTVLIGVFIFLTAGAPGLLDYLGGPRLTVFGPVAASVAVMAIASTTLCAAVLLVAAYGAGRRVIALCGYVRGRILEKAPPAPPGSEIPDLWNKGGSEMPNAFPATPVLAIDCGAGRLPQGFWTGNDASAASSPEKAGRAWAAELSKIMYKGETDGSRTRFALFGLLVSELSLFRWIAVGSVLSACASIGIVFLYPIEADSLLILNLLMLALAGMLCAYFAVVFECDGVLSNIVCNRPQRAEISIGLFSFIASPFVALAAAIALVEIPGVVDWAGGLFVMVRTLGIHP